MDRSRSRNSQLFNILSIFIFLGGIHSNAANTVTNNGRTYTCEGSLICSNGNCSCIDNSGNVTINENGTIQNRTGAESQLPLGYRRHLNGGGLVAESANVADTAYVGTNAVVEDGSEIRGTTHIGPNSVIRNARIVNSHIGPNSNITRSLVHNSQIGPNSSIEGMELIEQSIGPNSKLKGNYPQPRR